MKGIENREQRIRISTNQKLYIPQYMISLFLIPFILFRPWPQDKYGGNTSLYIAESIYKYNATFGSVLQDI